MSIDIRTLAEKVDEALAIHYRLSQSENADVRALMTPANATELRDLLCGCVRGWIEEVANGLEKRSVREWASAVRWASNYIDK